MMAVPAASHSPIRARPVRVASQIPNAIVRGRLSDPRMRQRDHTGGQRASERAIDSGSAMPDALTTKPAPPWPRRMLVLLTVLYVGAFAVWTRGAREPGAWCAAMLALFVAIFAGRRTGAAGAVLWGLAVVVASIGGSPSSAALGALAATGAFACVAAACVA